MTVVASLSAVPQSCRTPLLLYNAYMSPKSLETGVAHTHIHTHTCSQLLASDQSAKYDLLAQRAKAQVTLLTPRATQFAPTAKLTVSYTVTDGLKLLLIAARLRTRALACIRGVLDGPAHQREALRWFLSLRSCHSYDYWMGSATLKTKALDMKFGPQYVFERRECVRR